MVLVLGNADGIPMECHPVTSLQKRACRELPPVPVPVPAGAQERRGFPPRFNRSYSWPGIRHFPLSGSLSQAIRPWLHHRSLTWCLETPMSSASSEAVYHFFLTAIASTASRISATSSRRARSYSLSSNTKSCIRPRTEAPSA